MTSDDLSFFRGFFIAEEKVVVSVVTVQLCGAACGSAEPHKPLPVIQTVHGQH